MAKELVYETIHTIVLTLKPGKSGDKAKGVAPTPPEIKEVKAKRRVSLDPEAQDTKDFLRMGAIRLHEPPEAEEAVETVKKAPARKSPPKKPATKKAPAKKPAGEGEGGEGGEGDGSELV